MYVLISTHAVFLDHKDVHGPPHTISDYLKRNNIDHTFICHDLLRNDGATVYTYKKDKYFKTHRKRNFLIPRYLQEFLIIYSAFPRIKTIYIGVDSVNGFFGIIFKLFRKINILVFYSADYSEKRFTNNFLSWIYRWLNILCAKKADFVWSVSGRIQQVWKKRGISDEKNILIPNAPLLPKEFIIKKNKQKENIIIVSHLIKGIEFVNVFKAIKKLTSQYPKIKLTIVGEGELKKALEKMSKDLKLEKHVIFLGTKSHNEVLDIVNNSGIGIALYTEETSWSYYRDSIKLREYLALGLPVITTAVTGLSLEIKDQKVGFIVQPKDIEIEKAIDQLLKNNTLYTEYSRNALRLAKKYNISIILDKAWKKIKNLKT